MAMFDSATDNFAFDVDYYTVVYTTNGSMLAHTFKTFRIKRKPTDGNCTIEPSQGIANVTNFTINCFNWTDVDGNITQLQYSGRGIALFSKFVFK